MITNEKAIELLMALQEPEAWESQITDEAYEALDKAIEAIKALPSAEPHTFTVIDTKTGKEADTYKIALKEEWAKGLCYCDIDMFVIGEDGTLMLIDDCGNCAYCPQGRFEVKWNE